jgi:MoxR-like ATPase
LAKALAVAMSGSVRRIQFTPDLLPSDVTGVSVYEPERRTFEFRPGAVFANVVIGDEINRASPKTQSALLECMEERQVTVDGETYVLQPPFFVVATQNPVEMEGTYPLPEAQRDRFTAQVAMGYPSGPAELAMLDHHLGGVPLSELKPVTDVAEVAALVEAVRTVHVADDIRRYVVDLMTATRRHPELRLGASPRAGLQLLRTARAAAAFEGRSFVLPDDVQALASAVLSHRLLLTAEAAVNRRQTFDIVAELLTRVPLPQPTGIRRGR